MLALLGWACVSQLGAGVWNQLVAGACQQVTVGWPGRQMW